MALNNVGADSATYLTGLQVRTKYNTDLENLLTAFASGTAPTSPDANMYWLDTSGGTYAVLKKRNPDNDAWIEVFRIHLTEDALYYPGAFQVLENSDVVTITHDGTDLYLKTSDGRIVFQTDEGTNTDTEVVITGKGTGEGRLIMKGASNQVTVEVPALSADVTLTLPTSDLDLDTVSSGGKIPTGTRVGYMGASAPSGWVLLAGDTIGDASSGATERANADTEDLFTLLWNNYADGQCPVSGGRGATAAADFAAHKTLTLPDYRRRVAATYDSTGADYDAMGETGGEETHTLTRAELPDFQLGLPWGDSGGGGGYVINRNSYTPGDYSTLTSEAVGSGDAHENRQPYIIEQSIAKL